MSVYRSNVDFSGLATRLREATRALALSHAKPDGDAIGSSLAVRRLLAAHGATTEIALVGPIEPALGSLLAGEAAFREIDPKAPPSPESLASWLDGFDTILVVDTGTYGQLEPLADALRPVANGSSASITTRGATRRSRRCAGSTRPAPRRRRSSRNSPERWRCRWRPQAREASARRSSWASPPTPAGFASPRRGRGSSRSRRSCSKPASRRIASTRCSSSRDAWSASRRSAGRCDRSRSCRSAAMRDAASR